MNEVSNWRMNTKSDLQKRKWSSLMKRSRCRYRLNINSRNWRKYTKSSSRRSSRKRRSRKRWSLLLSWHRKLQKCRNSWMKPTRRCRSRLPQNRKATSLLKSKDFSQILRIRRGIWPVSSLIIRSLDESSWRLIFESWQTSRRLEKELLQLSIRPSINSLTLLWRSSRSKAWS